MVDATTERTESYTVSVQATLSFSVEADSRAGAEEKAEKRLRREGGMLAGDLLRLTDAYVDADADSVEAVSVWDGENERYF